MTTRYALLRSFGTLSVAGLMFTAGCESLGLGGDMESDNDRDRVSDRAEDRDRTASRERAQDRRERARDRDLDRDLDLGRRGDAAAEGVNSLPQGARKVRESEAGQRVRYRADRDGRVFAIDMEADRVVYSGPVRRDDLLVLDPSDDRAELNDRPVVATARLSGTHRHALYFLAD
jgi:hypothetical protein